MRPWLVIASLVVLTAVRADVHAGGAANDRQSRDEQLDAIALLLQELENTMQAGDPAAYRALLLPTANFAQSTAFAQMVFSSGMTRAKVLERDRVALAGSLPGAGYSLTLEVLNEFGAKARLSTWRLDVRRRESGEVERWGIEAQEVLSSIQWLYNLALAPERQYAARNFKVTAEDLELNLSSGSVFVADTDQGIPLLVLVGSGEMIFRPRPEAERGQMRIFAGSDLLRTSFDVALVRVHPADLENHLSMGALSKTAFDPRMFRRADEYFRGQVGKSFSLNLSDLSDQTWSLVPGLGDFVADVRTRKYATLTYARSNGEAEDITLFDRARRRNISLYPSERRLAERGPFYDEDELADYDVLDYDLDVAFLPDKQRLEGRATIRLRVKGNGLSTLTLRLAESLAVRSVAASGLGRLLPLQIRNQNSTVVNFPATVARDTVLTLAVSYGGRLAPQQIDRESIEVTPQEQRYEQDDALSIPLEPSFLYSNRSYWYPQSPVTDYARARMRLTAPSAYGVAASGDLESSSPALDAKGQPVPGSTGHIFNAQQPLRYLSVLITRLVPVRTDVVTIPDETGPNGHEAVRPGVHYRSLQLNVRSHPRPQGRARQQGANAAEIAQFYATLVGEFPYPTLTLSVVERELPGGHSPAYFISLAVPVPGTRLTWRNDPASFDDYPEFFLAHEIAHQWWGQAVGWKNYHEQWLSEGMAQYFAALYAEKARGTDVFAGVVRRLTRWGIEYSAEGPIYLGYRVGHLGGDSRVNRAVIYNKSAAVLHMLRRLLGDKAFFGGIRRFYNEWRFRKAGTDDLRRAFEAESGQSLGRFFERWIYGASLPRLHFRHHVEQGANGQEVVLRLEHLDEIFDMPVTVTIELADGTSTELMMPIRDKTAELRVPVSGQVRRVQVNRDGAAVAASIAQ